jgi:hypothetical protein
MLGATSRPQRAQQRQPMGVMRPIKRRVVAAPPTRPAPAASPVQLVPLSSSAVIVTSGAAAAAAVASGGAASAARISAAAVPGSGSATVVVGLPRGANECWLITSVQLLSASPSWDALAAAVARGGCSRRVNTDIFRAVEQLVQSVRGQRGPATQVEVTHAAGLVETNLLRHLVSNSVRHGQWVPGRMQDVSEAVHAFLTALRCSAAAEVVKQEFRAAVEGKATYVDGYTHQRLPGGLVCKESRPTSWGEGPQYPLERASAFNIPPSACIAVRKHLRAAWDGQQLGGKGVTFLGGRVDPTGVGEAVRRGTWAAAENLTLAGNMRAKAELSTALPLWELLAFSDTNYVASSGGNCKGCGIAAYAVTDEVRFPKGPAHELVVTVQRPDHSGTTVLAPSALTYTLPGMTWRYELVSVGLKTGGSESGHWTAAKQLPDSRWVSCDDSNVVAIEGSIDAWLHSSVRLETATVFWYKRGE